MHPFFLFHLVNASSIIYKLINWLYQSKEAQFPMRSKGEDNPVYFDYIARVLSA